MIWKKHILIGALVLNCVLYLSTALWIAVINTRHSDAALAHYATLPHQTMDIELARLSRILRDSLAAHHRGEFSMTEKILPPQSPLLKLVDVSKIISGKLEHLASFTHPVSIPLLLLEKNQSFRFMHFDKNKRLYISTTLGPIEYEVNKDKIETTPYSYLLTFEVPADLLIKTITVADTVHLSIIEQDASMTPFVLYTNLKPEENKLLLAQSPLKSNSDFLHFANLENNQEHSKTVFQTTFSGTKNIVYPFILNTSSDIQQVMYYILPLPEFDSLSVETVFIIVTALLATLSTAIFVGVTFAKNQPTV